MSSVSRSSAQADVREMRQLFDQVMKSGAKLQKRGSSYYLRANVQTSAKNGVKAYKVDAKLAQAILQAESSGGRTSLSEVANTILPRIFDGNKYTAGEAVLARMLLAATDDRKAVKLNGVHIDLTNPAEAKVKHDLFSWWGSLGASARWGAQEVVPS
ncbi:MAG: hypothetical protein ACOZIN_07585 [Myxococcota bacterium]